MAVICFIINLLAPITNFLGVIGFCIAFSRDEWGAIYCAIPFAIAGLVFGIFAYTRDIPPRWFWSRSANELFSFSVTAVLGYAINFAAYPLAWYIASDFISQIS